MVQKRLNLNPPRLEKTKEKTQGLARLFGCVAFLGVMLFVFAPFESQCLGQRCYGSFMRVEYVGNYDRDTITFRIKGVHLIVGENIKGKGKRHRYA